MYKNIFDTHAHVLKETYKDDYDSIIKKLHDKKIVIMSIGFDLETTKEGIELAKKYRIWNCAIGIHPTNVLDYDKDIFKKLEKLYLENCHVIKAIGETGLDNKYKIDKKQQIYFFKKHIELAKKYQLPVIIHCREAFNEVYDIIKDYEDVVFLFHSWSHGEAEMQKCLKHNNIWFSFSGMVTYPKNKNTICKTLQIVPKNRFVIETDSPWLTPSPYQEKRNDPSFVIEIGKFIAKQLNMNEQDIFDLTFKNAKILFKII